MARKVQEEWVLWGFQTRDGASAYVLPITNESRPVAVVAKRRESDGWVVAWYKKGDDPVGLRAQFAEWRARNGLSGDVIPIERARDRARYVVRDAAARAFYVSAWADDAEERGDLPDGGDLMDKAPATPRDATAFATKFIDKVEEANHASVADLLVKAAKADGKKPAAPTEYARLFGHYIAMQAMGHGVSWWDDHARFELFLPDVEFHVEDEKVAWAELGRARDRA